MASKISNAINMMGNLLLNVAGLTDSAGNPLLAGWKQVSTYAAMIALGTPNNLLFVKVTNDEDKGTTHQEYDLWPDGQRLYNGKNDKLVDYSQTGNVISDGGSPWANDSNQGPTKAFDQNINTWYRPGGSNAYVGRDLLAAKSISSLVLTPVQDSSNASSLNGAQVQYSTDNSSWNNIGSAVSGVTSSNYATPVTMSFAATSARYWRLSIAQGAFIAEIQIYSTRA